VNHKALYKKYVEEVVIANYPKGPHAREPLTKKNHITPSAISGFLFYKSFQEKQQDIKTFLERFYIFYH